MYMISLSKHLVGISWYLQYIALLFLARLFAPILFGIEVSAPSQMSQMGPSFWNENIKHQVLRLTTYHHPENNVSKTKKQPLYPRFTSKVWKTLPHICHVVQMTPTFSQSSETSKAATIWTYRAAEQQCPAWETHMRCQQIPSKHIAEDIQDPVQENFN